MLLRLSPANRREAIITINTFTIFTDITAITAIAAHIMADMTVASNPTYQIALPAASFIFTFQLSSTSLLTVAGNGTYSRSVAIALPFL